MTIERTRPEAQRESRIPALEVQDLAIDIDGHRVVDGVDFGLDSGQRCGLIGESGSGKSMTALSLLGLLPPGARATGSIRLNGQDVLGLPEARWAKLRGSSITMIFQDAVSGLNPLVRVDRQVAEPLRRHQGLSAEETRVRVLSLLSRVGFDAPERAARCHPPQLSGGQRQRVAIAMALACGPAVLVADEPTTSLDATVQAAILDLLREVTGGEDGPALLFVSHDLPVVAQLCTDVVVVHDGAIVENGPISEVVRAPRHPRTADLVESASALESGSRQPDHEIAS